MKSFSLTNGTDRLFSEIYRLMRTDLCIECVWSNNENLLIKKLELYWSIIEIYWLKNGINYIG